MKNQRAIQCDTCNLWAHIKCDGTSTESYSKMMDDVDNTEWHCLVCRIRFDHINIPFTLNSNTDLDNITNSDSMKMYEMLPTFEILSEVSKFNNLDSYDVDINITNNVSCKYYSVNNFYKHLNDNIDNFNIFHSNLNGLETHFENLHEFLSSIPIDFDVINITETSQKVTENFKLNISIDGYDPFFTPSNSGKGGTGIYIKKMYDTIERSDLNILIDDFESMWVEIKNNKSKNIVCGCIYRHPRSNLKEFQDYMKRCLEILSKENKEVYISGDFNVDLLKLETNTSYEDFYNLVTSYGFLPEIVNPTRVTDTSATVIDNIFTD